MGAGTCSGPLLVGERSHPTSTAWPTPAVAPARLRPVHRSVTHGRSVRCHVWPSGCRGPRRRRRRDGRGASSARVEVLAGAGRGARRRGRPRRTARRRRAGRGRRAAASSPRRTIIERRVARTRSGSSDWIVSADQASSVRSSSRTASTAAGTSRRGERGVEDRLQAGRVGQERRAGPTAAPAASAVHRAARLGPRPRRAASSSRPDLGPGGPHDRPALAPDGQAAEPDDRDRRGVEVDHRRPVCSSTPRTKAPSRQLALEPAAAGARRGSSTGCRDGRPRRCRSAG